MLEILLPKRYFTPCKENRRCAWREKIALHCFEPGRPIGTDKYKYGIEQVDTCNVSLHDRKRTDCCIKWFTSEICFVERLLQLDNDIRMPAPEIGKPRCKPLGRETSIGAKPDCMSRAELEATSSSVNKLKSRCDLFMVSLAPLRKDHAIVLPDKQPVTEEFFQQVYMATDSAN
ncbi:hypothetical protein HY30_16220 [Hyphomonas chukchiensis]|uniref:Uncharacterized protein n=1 Tax=Hyphomonas chukchiensis TaxID=1280947 RepID=A0A062UJR1_9PROT|nr:hypothetical protein HY30_16220 [Hyphomonas chukchiensis]